MNKQELVDKIAEKTDLTKKDTLAAVDAIVSSIVESLEKGEAVTLVGFGTFKIAERAARTGRNPQTGASIEIPAKKTPKFTPGKVFKGKVQ